MKRRSYIRLRIAGTMAINKDSARAGRRPVINPRIGVGSSSIQLKKETFFAKKLIFEMIPTNAHGIAQNKIMTKINP
jgi:hypothetical protein